LGLNPGLRDLKLCTDTDSCEKQGIAAQLLELLPALCFGTLSVQLAGHAELGCTSAKNYRAEIAKTDKYEL
jgi:hypothetical protein